MNDSINSVLVVGGTGFIGGAVIKALLAAGIPTTALAFVDRDQPVRLASVEGLEILTVASSRTEHLAPALAGRRFNHVINLAAGGVGPGGRNPDDMMDSNAGLLSRLLEAVSSSPPKIFLHTGSWSEYAPPHNKERLTEDHPLEARSVYGVAKAAATTAGTGLAASLGIPFVTLRLFHVFGPGEAAHRLNPYLIDRLSAGKPAALSPGDQVRDFVFVGDVAQAYIAAVQAPDFEKHSAYNISSGQPVTVRHAAEVVADALGRPRDLLHFGALSARQDEAPWVVGDNARFAEAAGWRASTSLRDGVEQTVAAAGTGSNKHG